MMMTTNGHALAHGTISHGTLVTEDLIKAFLPEIERYYVRKPNCAYEAEQWLSGKDVYQDAYYGILLSDDEYQTDGSALVSLLIDALDSICPKGTYFGPHLGDGADFGFWPCEDENE